MNEHQRRPSASSGVPVEERVTTLETRWDTVIPTLATKSDLLGVKAELKQEMAGLRSDLTQEMAGLRSELKQDIHRLEFTVKDAVLQSAVRLHKLDASLRTWMLGSVTAGFVGLGGLVVALIPASRWTGAPAPTEAHTRPRTGVTTASPPLADALNLSPAGKLPAD